MSILETNNFFPKFCDAPPYFVNGCPQFDEEEVSICQDSIVRKIVGG